MCVILKVSIKPYSGKKIEHMGIKIELLGQIGELNVSRVFIFHDIMGERGEKG